MTATKEKPKATEPPAPKYSRETTFRVPASAGQGRSRGAAFCFDSETRQVQIKTGQCQVNVPVEALAGAMGELFREARVSAQMRHAARERWEADRHEHEDR